jgi:SPP1 family predicted phage head-tail adaptor
VAINRNKTTNIGELRQQVKLQSYTTVSDGMGGSYGTWSDVSTTWADIRPLSGNEILEFGAIHGNVSHRVVLRYQANISNENRFVYKGRSFNIKYALNLGEDSKILELLASEEVAHGNDS